MPVMLILRGVNNLLHEKPALEYARRRGYTGRVLQASGEAYADAPQVRAAIRAIEADPAITALYGFSGGGYNARHILDDMTSVQRGRFKLVVILGAPNNGRRLYAGPWELVYRNDPPGGHMAGPDALLAELGPEPPPVIATGPPGPPGKPLPSGWWAQLAAAIAARWPKG